MALLISDNVRHSPSCIKPMTVRSWRPSRGPSCARSYVSPPNSRRGVGAVNASAGSKGGTGLSVTYRRPPLVRRFQPGSPPPGIRRDTRKRAPGADIDQRPPVSLTQRKNSPRASPRSRLIGIVIIVGFEIEEQIKDETMYHRRPTQCSKRGELLSLDKVVKRGHEADWQLGLYDHELIRLRRRRHLHKLWRTHRSHPSVS